MLTHPSAKKKRLLAVVEQIPGAWVGLKIAALLLVLEGQRPGWILRGLGGDAHELRPLDSWGER